MHTLLLSPHLHCASTSNTFLAGSHSSSQLRRVESKPLDLGKGYLPLKK